jgi:hypothetical protein
MAEDVCSMVFILVWKWLRPSASPTTSNLLAAPKTFRSKKESFSDRFLNISTTKTKHWKCSFYPSVIASVWAFRLSPATYSEFHPLKEYSLSFTAHSKRFHPLYLRHLQQRPLNFILYISSFVFSPTTVIRKF